MPLPRALLFEPMRSPFVGSGPVAESIYGTAAARGTRAQALAGAKNSPIVVPDTDLAETDPAFVSPPLATRQRYVARGCTRATLRDLLGLPDPETFFGWPVEMGVLRENLLRKLTMRTPKTPARRSNRRRAAGRARGVP